MKKKNGTLKRLALFLFLLCTLYMCTGCTSSQHSVSTSVPAQETASQYTAEPSPTPMPATDAPQTDAPQQKSLEEQYADMVEKEESYSDKEHVCAYLITYGTLPGNFITKTEAQKLGWESSKGNLWEVAPGKSIGGDYFGNYEELLPKGRYKECDIDYNGGYRGSKRIIYTSQGDLAVYYTDDHYNSFTKLYPKEEP